MIRALLLLLSLALPAPAMAAEPPFDLDALRVKWPGANAVLIERHVVFSMPDPVTMQVRTEQHLAILDDSAQEDLVLFTASRRPGCRDPHDLSIQVTDPDGRGQPWDGEVLELAAGDHPVHAERSSVTLSASRRGLSAGALLVESWAVDYHADCFGGFLGTERYFVEPAWPVEHVLVEVTCAGSDCYVATDIPGALTFEPRDGGGVKVEGFDVPAAAPEFSVPSQSLPVIIVATSADKNVLGQILTAGLDAEIERAESVADTHRELAEANLGHVAPRSVRYARYLDEHVPRLSDQAFWQFGFDWGGPVAAGRRPLLPLEWWALALSILKPHGGIPVVLDPDTHLSPPDIGRVVSYRRIGVLLPGRGLLTDAGWFALTPTGDGEESNALLAGMWILRLEDGISLERFGRSAELEGRGWTVTATPSTGDKLLVDITRAYQGERGGRLRSAYLDDQAEWEKDNPAGRGSQDKRNREFAVQWLFGHRVGRTEVRTVEDDPGFFELQTSFSRPGFVQRGDGLVAVSLPILVHDDLRHLVGPSPDEQRVSDYAFSLAMDRIELKVLPPAGYRLVDVPESRALEAGPVVLEVTWTAEGLGARLDYRFSVSERIVPATQTAALQEIGEEMRRLLRTRLLFVPE